MSDSALLGNRLPTDNSKTETSVVSGGSNKIPLNAVEIENLCEKANCIRRLREEMREARTGAKLNRMRKEESDRVVEFAYSLICDFGLPGAERNTAGQKCPTIRFPDGLVVYVWLEDKPADPRRRAKTYATVEFERSINQEN